MKLRFNPDNRHLQRQRYIFSEEARPAWQDPSPTILPPSISMHNKPYRRLRYIVMILIMEGSVPKKIKKP
ncbi:hypothetical protein A9970_03225 [Sphingobacterium sp. UME9]|nr:hypothetical protein [Sphingobacterium sp. UME9]